MAGSSPPTPACAPWPRPRTTATSSARRLRDVVLLSLGTGTSLTYIKGKNLDWGYAQWARPLLNLMLDGVGGIADYQTRQMLGPKYYRLAPKFPTGVSIQMDDVKRIPDMIAFANNVSISGAAAWLKKNWI